MVFHTFTSLLKSSTSSLHSSLWSNYPALIVSKWKSRTNRQELPYSTPTFLGIFPVCPPETKEKVCCFSHSSASPGAGSLMDSCCHPLSLSQVLLLQLYPILLIIYPPLFQWGYSLQLTNMIDSPLCLKVLLWFLHPSPITAHFSSSIRSLMSQDSCLHTYLHCLTFDHSSKLSNWVSSLTISPKLLVSRLP